MYKGGCLKRMTLLVGCQWIVGAGVAVGLRKTVVWEMIPGPQSKEDRETDRMEVWARVCV